MKVLQYSILAIIGIIAITLRLYYFIDKPTKKDLYITVVGGIVSAIVIIGLIVLFAK